MIWAVVALAVLVVGLPAAGWWISRRPVTPDSWRGRAQARARTEGLNEADRWLRTEYGLDWRQRTQVRRAVDRGTAVADPDLQPAALGLAERILSGQSRPLDRVYRLGGWMYLVGACFEVTAGIIELNSGHGFFMLVLGALFGGLGIAWLVVIPRRTRRNARRLLCDGGQCG